ncbi:hypothetical protein ACFL5O_06225 [Myxococcota bacterium]
MCDDACVDVGTNIQHCGACERTCSLEGVDEAVCVDGLCTSSCQAGWGNCYQPVAPALDNGCETDINNSICHCGGCDRACVAGGGVQAANCNAGLCDSMGQDGYANEHLGYSSSSTLPLGACRSPESPTSRVKPG